jgi:hypothetical protein
MDERWASFNITAEFLDAKATWLKERRDLSGRTLAFFVLAGKLVSLSRDDYELASLAFFQAIIGVERALRQHFLGADNLEVKHNAIKFRRLFKQAVDQKLVTNSAFSVIRPFPADLQKQLAVAVLGKDNFSGQGPFTAIQKEQLAAEVPTHSNALSFLVPHLRNQFVHGTYLLSPEYLHLTFQMREIADVLSTASHH